MAAVSRPRLTAAERRADLLRVAGRVFAEGSYRGATTAEIAREAGVTEPILYRHFASKEDLYLACVEEAWATVKATWERVVEQERDPSKWMPAMGNAFLRPAEDKVLLGSLWVQALTEASDSERIVAVIHCCDSSRWPVGMKNSIGRSMVTSSPPRRPVTSMNDTAT